MPPAFTALTNLAAVKAIGNITNTNSDTLLNQLIAAVSAAISQYCNRNFGIAAYTENYSGSGNDTLWLRQRPIVSVTSVTMNAYTIPPRPNVNAYGWANDLNKLFLAGGIFWEGPLNIVVAYSAGITVGASQTPDLWQAAAEWVYDEYMSDTQHIDKGSVTSGQGQSTVFLKAMPWYVKQAVDPYRQVATEGQVLGN